MAKSLFNVPQRAGREADKAIAHKANANTVKAPTSLSGGGGLAGTIKTIRAFVEQNLGKYVDEYILIQDRQTLHDYMTACVEQGVVAIDTETTGLDPIADDIVGISIYTPGQKAAYIPINHISYVTMIKSDNQLSVNVIRDEMMVLVEKNVDVVMFNACFDIRFIRNKIGVYLKCDWDCYLAARLLNENEGAGNNNLKNLHRKYVMDGEGDAFRFDDLFKGVCFNVIPIKTGYLYAAHDAIITYELYEFQKPYLTATDPECIDRGLQDVAWVFDNIEMPCVEVIADMEDLGVDFDYDVANNLHDVYHAKMAEKTEQCYKILGMYDTEISMYRAKNPGNKLSDPINLDSPVQIAILLYDIMGVKSVDKDSPRGTGEKILAKIDNDFTKALVEYREVVKLLGTYIDKLPECVNKKDHRIHCKFNQYGADTGRMSSSDPNLQNIPSHNKDIRKMFKATNGYVMMSSDFSQSDNSEFIQVPNWGSVETPDGLKLIRDLSIGDKIVFDDSSVGILTEIKTPVDKSKLLLYYILEVSDVDSVQSSQHS